MKKRLFLRGWGDYGDFYSLVENMSKKPDEIYIMTPEEVTPSCVYSDLHWTMQELVMKDYQTLVQYTSKNNIKIYIVLGQAYDDRYSATLTYFWNDYFLYRVMNRNLEKSSHVPIKPFISLNGRITTGRCRFIDHFYKYNMFDKGYMSISNNGNLNVDFSVYRWKYWKDPSLFFIDKIDLKDGNPAFKIIPEYFDGYFSFGSETKEHLVFVTEKTYLPIYFKKPFLLYAGKGQYAFLKSQGFKLFENIVDYSFDNIEDHDERADAIVYQMKCITEIDLQTLIDKTKDTCEYNYKKMVEIYNKKDFNQNIKRIINLCDTDEYDVYKF